MLYFYVTTCKKREISEKLSFDFLINYPYNSINMRVSRKILRLAKGKEETWSRKF